MDSSFQIHDSTKCLFPLGKTGENYTKNYSKQSLSTAYSGNDAADSVSTDKVGLEDTSKLTKESSFIASFPMIGRLVPGVFAPSKFPATETQHQTSSNSTPVHVSHFNREMDDTPNEDKVPKLARRGHVKNCCCFLDPWPHESFMFSFQWLLQGVTNDVEMQELKAKNEEMTRKVEQMHEQIKQLRENVQESKAARRTEEVDKRVDEAEDREHKMSAGMKTRYERIRKELKKTASDSNKVSAFDIAALGKRRNHSHIACMHKKGVSKKKRSRNSKKTVSLTPMKNSIALHFRVSPKMHHFAIFHLAVYSSKEEKDKQ